jgi:hypothetical protein
MELQAYEDAMAEASAVLKIEEGKFKVYLQSNLNLSSIQLKTNLQTGTTGVGDESICLEWTL